MIMFNVQSQTLTDKCFWMFFICLILAFNQLLMIKIIWTIKYLLHILYIILSKLMSYLATLLGSRLVKLFMTACYSLFYNTLKFFKSRHNLMVMTFFKYIVKFVKCLMWLIIDAVKQQITIKISNPHTIHHYSTDSFKI